MILRPFATEADHLAGLPAELLGKQEVISFMRARIPGEISGDWPSLLSKGKSYDLSSSVKLKVIIGEEMRYGDAALYLALPGPGLAEPILIIVTRGTPGFRVGRLLPSMGLRAPQISELIFEDCRIAQENLLGEYKFDAKRSGFRAGLQVFNVMRPVVGALAVGIARAAIDYLEEGLETDRASHCQARSWLEMERDIEAMKPKLQAARLLCWKAAWLYDEGRDNTREASVAKVLASRTAINICSRTLDLARRANLSNLLILEKLCRDVRAFEFLEGTEDVLKLSIAKTLTR